MKATEIHFSRIYIANIDTKTSRRHTWWPNWHQHHSTEKSHSQFRPYLGHRKRTKTDSWFPKISKSTSMSTRDCNSTGHLSLLSKWNSRRWGSPEDLKWAQHSSGILWKVKSLSSGSAPLSLNECVHVSRWMRGSTEWMNLPCTSDYGMKLPFQVHVNHLCKGVLFGGLQQDSYKITFNRLIWGLWLRFPC